VPPQPTSALKIFDLAGGAGGSRPRRSSLLLAVGEATPRRRSYSWSREPPARGAPYLFRASLAPGPARSAHWGVRSPPLMAPPDRGRARRSCLFGPGTGVAPAPRIERPINGATGGLRSRWDDPRPETGLRAGAGCRGLSGAAAGVRTVPGAGAAPVRDARRGGRFEGRGRPCTAGQPSSSRRSYRRAGGDGRRPYGGGRAVAQSRRAAYPRRPPWPQASYWALRSWGARSG
jgi:hypothetical protein